MPSSTSDLEIVYNTMPRTARDRSTAEVFQKFRLIYPKWNRLIMLIANESQKFVVIEREIETIVVSCE